MRLHFPFKHKIVLRNQSCYSLSLNSNPNNRGRVNTIPTSSPVPNTSLVTSPSIYNALTNEQTSSHLRRNSLITNKTTPHPSPSSRPKFHDPHKSLSRKIIPPSRPEISC